MESKKWVTNNDCARESVDGRGSIGGREVSTEGEVSTGISGVIEYNSKISKAME